MDLGLSGLASGFDWKSVVDKLAEVERAPQATMYAEQTRIQERNNAFSALKTSLNVLRNRISSLNEEGLFERRTGTSSDTKLGSVTVADGGVVGQFKITVSQLATASKTVGTSGVGSGLSTSDDVSGLALSAAGFSTPVTAGTFTVNGKQVSVEATDTLGAVLNKISDATGGDVTASYSAATDRITLTSASPIVLGSATDSSNFLQAARLHGNNQATLTSESELGAIRLGATLDTANFATAITGGTTGEFKINGVAIQYDATKDSVSTVLARINASDAGVIASYDSINDRFTLANKGTGSTGIALEDSAGSNFLAATGLSSGTIQVGKNLLYTVDDGPTLTSQSNTITEGSSGLTGLSITALAQDTFTVTVNEDTTAVKSAVTSLVEAYNAAQSQLASYTVSSTDAKGKVTAGVLADDPEAAQIASQLRALATGTLSGLTGSITRLDDLGIASNGYDDSLSTSGIDALDEALASSLSDVKSFFTDEAIGWAVSFDAFLESAIGDEGSLTAHQATLTKQASALTTQIEDQEKWVQAEIERLTLGFIAMETAQAKSNQQLQFLTQTFTQS